MWLFISDVFVVQGSDSVIGCVYDEASGRVKIEASWNFANPRRNRPLSNV